MNVLLIGSGGREHAIAQKISESARKATQVTSTEVIVQEKHIGLGAALTKLGKRLGMR